MSSLQKTTPDLRPGYSYTALALIVGVVDIDNVGRYQCPVRMGAAQRGVRRLIPDYLKLLGPSSDFGELSL